MKILSWNVCINMDNTNGVVDFLSKEKAEIVCLQEATRPIDKKSFKQYQLVEDVKAKFYKSHPYNFFAPSFVADKLTKDGKITHDFGGLIEQGNYVMSSYEIKSAGSKFYYNDYAQWFDHSDFRKNDWARNLLVCVVELNGRLIKVLNVHGMINQDRVGNDKTMKQSEFILNEALRDDMPVIVVGDFNLIPESESVKLLDKHLKNLSSESKIKTTRSVGSGKDDVVVDYIFVNDKIKVRDFKIFNSEVSDHLPLMLDFDLI